MDIARNSSENFSQDKNHFGLNDFYLNLGKNIDKIMKGINCELIDLNPQTRSTTPLLPFITFFQFLEKLTDRTALEAVNNRVEWKNALHLPIAPLVKRESIFCEFRTYLLKEEKRLSEYQRLINRLSVFLPGKMIQKIDAAQMLIEVCEFNRNNIAVIKLNKALTYLKVNHPEWFKKHNMHQLYDRYQAATSQYDVLIPHDVSQFNIDDVMKDIDFLVKKIESFGSEEIKKLDEISKLSHLASQFPVINNEKQIESDCDNIIDA